MRGLGLAITAMMVLAYGCTRLAEQQFDTMTEAPRRLASFVGGNHVEVLSDGPRIENALLDAVAGASDSVNLETYILAADDVGTRLADALIAARRRGVTVNLMYDSFGSHELGDDFLQRLRAAGVVTLEFNPVNPLLARGAWRPNNRDHRKLMVVDGSTAILGGANIPRPDRIHLKSQWRDTDILIAGPVVADFQDLFIKSWLAQSGDRLPAAAYYPLLRPVGDQEVWALGEGPDSNNIYSALVAAIGAAQMTVHLTTPYFAPDPTLLRAISRRLAGASTWHS